MISDFRFEKVAKRLAQSALLIMIYELRFEI